ncbi:MAG: Abi family protein [Clostridia bacterium]|nr:Abi family protein [Clostridia bacterium]
MNNPRKPKMSAEELVRKMRDEKGITFNYMSEWDAVQYLRNTENYMRVASYRKNYTKIQGGKNDGKYEHLDFGYLKELSEIDKDLRTIILRMCLEIEHALKVRIIKDIEDDIDCDGYTLVKDFLDLNPKIVESIEAKSVSIYIGELIHKYFSISDTSGGSGRRKHNVISDYGDCPVWVFVELLTYGEFIKFYSFYYKGSEPVKEALLHLVQSMRNGVAHNSCVISNLYKGGSRTPSIISSVIKDIPTLTKSQRQSRLAVRCMLEFTAVLYVFAAIVPEKQRCDPVQKLKGLFHYRMTDKKEYFEGNNILVCNYRFACRLIDYML